MIYYFSGTGNSKWVAEELARLTCDTAVSIADIVRSGGHAEVPEGQPVGLVFPVYAWLPPEIVSSFVSELSADKDAYRWAVCTCGDDAGRALEKLSKKFSLTSAWSLRMPNNYIRSFDTDPEDTVREKIRGAKQRLKQIAQDILERKKVWDIQSGRLAGLKSALIGPAFNKFARDDKPFYSELSCTGYGLCESLCPADNIRLEGGRPIWLGHCLQCLACIHRCPERAIEYGKETKGKGRYYFSEKYLD
jgi:NAD-dependent dihydropyrimidine dehydrogenase PreA subunit